MLYTDGSLVEARNSDEEMPETIADPLTGEPAFTVVYRNVDGWRGHYETEPVDGCGWTKIEGGWVGGEWDDLPDENRSSAVMARIDALAETKDLFVVIAPSSNVFAMMYDLYEHA